MVSMLINMLYNVVDRAYIGNGVGTEALAGLALTMPLMILTAAFGMMGGVGTGAVVSILLGEGKKHEAERALGQLFFLCLVSIVTLQSLALYFLDDILVWFGGNSDTIPFARDYLRIILFGSVFQHLSFSFASQLRAEGNARKCMYTILIGAITNIILDPLFIFVMHMGIKGAAYATIISMMASSSFVLEHFLRGRGTLRLHLRNIRPNPRMILRIVSIGLAPCLVQIAASAINIAFNRCLNAYSETQAMANEGIASWSIMTSIHFIFLTPLMGLAQGMQPMIGFNFGARKWSRVLKTYKSAILAGLLICGTGAAIISIFAPYLVRIFTSSPTMVDTASHGLRIFMTTFTIIAIDIINVHYFQSTGHASVAIFLGLQRQLIFFLPSLILLCHFCGVRHIWWCQPIADCVTCLISSCIGIHILHTLKQKAKEDLGDRHI